MASSSLLRPAGLGSMVLWLAGGACREATAPQVSGPFLQAARERDFGVVFEGQVVEHEWELRVAAPLSIAEARTDCGCTLASLERATPAGREAYLLGAPLVPGEPLFVSVRYDTRGRPGPSRRAVTLRTEGGHLVPLTIAADIRPWLVVEPRELEYQRVLEGAGSERDFRIRSATGEPFGLVATRRALPPWVEVELVPESPGGDGRARSWRGRALLTAAAPRGPLSYPLELQSDVGMPGPLPGGSAPRTHSASPSWSIRVVGPVELSSPNLEFGVMRANETVAKSVVLESFDPSFAPTSASAHLEPLHAGEAFPLGRTARVRTRPAGQACEIELVLAGLDGEVAGTFLAKLVVETGHPRLPRLDALVRGVRAPETEAR